MSRPIHLTGINEPSRSDQPAVVRQTVSRITEAPQISGLLVMLRCFLTDRGVELFVNGPCVREIRLPLGRQLPTCQERIDFSDRVECGDDKTMIALIDLDEPLADGPRCELGLVSLALGRCDWVRDPTSSSTAALSLIDFRGGTADEWKA